MARATDLAICFTCALFVASASRISDDDGAQPGTSAAPANPTWREAVTKVFASSSIGTHAGSGVFASLAGKSDPASARPDYNYADFILTVTANPFKKSDYWVFIKSVALLPGTSTVAAHTELAICARRKDGNKDADSKDIEDIIKQDLASGCSARASRFLSRTAANTLASYLPRCMTLTYTRNMGVSASYGQGPDDPTVYGMGSQNSIGLTWVGVVKDFHLWSFVEKMQECGNWKADDYAIRSNNCNMFSEASLKGMGFPGDFGLLSSFESRFLEKPGYVDAKTGKCQGMKCTEFGPAKGLTGYRPCTKFTNSSGAAVGT